MKHVQKMAAYFKIVSPFFIVKQTCKTKNIKRSSTGINAGYMKKLPAKSFFISKMKLLCIPQPGQSICVIDLNRQGS
ncbi:MAG: hypothetical protein R2765_09045 [Ferruginibacter sp.]